MPKNTMNTAITVIKKDPVKGRGVYAAEKIDKGELVEVCELIIIDLDEVQGNLERYVYQYSARKAAIALGNGSLYNHSKKNNCDFTINPRKRHLYIRAIKTINPGEELTINYRYDASLKKKFRLLD